MRRLTLVAGTLGVMALVGVVAQTGGQHHAQKPTSPSDRAATWKGADTSASSIPVTVGSADLEAARRAGARAVAMTGEVARAGLISRRELIESFSTVRYGPRLAGDTSQAVNAMFVELGQRDVDPSSLLVVEQPITATSDAVG